MRKEQRKSGETVVIRGEYCSTTMITEQYHKQTPIAHRKDRDQQLVFELCPMVVVVVVVFCAVLIMRNVSQLKLRSTVTT